MSICLLLKEFVKSFRKETARKIVHKIAIFVDPDGMDDRSKGPAAYINDREHFRGDLAFSHSS
jgi:hypothetical protein